MTDQLLYGLILMIVVGAAVVGVVFAPAKTTEVLGFAGMICLSLLSLLQTKKTVEKVEGLTTVATDTQALGQVTHDLVNSNMAAQLMVSYSALRRVADLTKDPIDVAAADEAKRLYDIHQARQAVVDIKAGVAAGTVLPPPAAPVVPSAPGGTTIEHMEVVATDVSIATLEKSPPERKE